jgi:hypothetical protein
MSLGNTFVYEEKVDKAITQQHQNEAYLLIDSLDQNPLDDQNLNYIAPVVNTTYNNYFINHQKLNAFGQLTKCSIVEYNWNWMTPNVNPRNQYFFLATSTPGKYIYIIVPEDFYTPTELATAMQTLLNTTQYKNYPTNTASTYGQAGGTPAGAWSVSLNSKTDAFIITNSNPAITFFPAFDPNFTTDSNINAIIGYDAARADVAPYRFQKNQYLPIVLGTAWSSISSYLVGSVVSYENSNYTCISVPPLGTPPTNNIYWSENAPLPNPAYWTPLINLYEGSPPTMAYTQYIDVCSNALTKFQTLKDSLTQYTYTDIICRIYLESGLNFPAENGGYFGSRPQALYRQISDPKYMMWRPDQMIGGIDISYRDDSGNLLYMPQKAAFNSRQIFTMKLVQA